MKIPRWSPERLDSDDWELVFANGLRVLIGPEKRGERFNMKAEQRSE